jgi:putative flippase GtrA
MTTFLKLQISALLATLTDWLATFLLAGVIGLEFVISGIAGTAAGAAINFMINRNWVFYSQNEKALTQAKRYILIWIGYLALSGMGLFLLSNVFQLNGMTSKISTSVFLGITYNYFFQKLFVFKSP